MAYEKNTWESGDVVTSEKLNNLEDGVDSAQLPAVTDADDGDVLTVVDGTWAKAASPVVVVTEDMLSEPTADGVSNTTVVVSEGEKQFQLNDVYVIDVPTSELGSDSNPRLFMTKNEDGTWQVYNTYYTFQAVDLAQVADNELGLTGDCVILYNDYIYMLPSDAPLAKGENDK